MATYNKISIIGYLGRDPEVRYLNDGTAVCSISVATTEKRKSGGEAQEVTTWFRASAFGKLADIAGQYLSKGSQVYLEGRLSQNEYTDRDGNKRTSLEVRVSELQFLGSRGDEQSKPKDELDGARDYQQRQVKDKQMPKQVSIDESDIPF